MQDNTRRCNMYVVHVNDWNVKLLENGDWKSGD